MAIAEKVFVGLSFEQRWNTYEGNGNIQRSSNSKPELYIGLFQCNSYISNNPTNLNQQTDEILEKTIAGSD